MKKKNFWVWMWLGIVMLLVGAVLFGVDITKQRGKDVDAAVLMAILALFGFGGWVIILTASGYNPGEPNRFLHSGKKYYKHGQEVRITEGGSLCGKEFTLVWLHKEDNCEEILGYKLEVEALLDKNQKPISVIPDQFMVLKHQDKYHLIEVVEKQKDS